MKQTMKMLLTIMDKRKQFQFMIISILIVIQSLLETLAVVVIFPFMYLVMGDGSLLDNKWIMLIINTFKLQDSGQVIIAISIIMIGLYFIKDAYGVFTKWVQAKWMSNLHVKIASDVFTNFLHRKYSYYLSSEAADITRAATDDINRLYETIKAVFDLFQKLFMSLFLVISIIVINPTFALVGCTSIGICVLIINKFIQFRIRRYGQAGTNAMTRIISWINQSSGIIKNILVNKKQDYYVDKFTDEAKNIYKSRTSYEVLSVIPGKLVEVICMTGIFSYLIVLTIQGAKLESMISQFAVFALAIVKILPSVVGINGDINKLKYNNPALEFIIDNLKFENEIEKEDIERIDDLKESIVLENISYSYDDNSPKLYDRLDFFIKGGSTIGFVGATGSGKTTLVDIIIGLHAPTTGKVKVDGHDIQLNKKGWGAQIGYIPQNIYLCNTTVKENVAFGEENIDENKVIDCLKEAQVYDFINSMSEGIDTVIGDNGIRLSGGQRQRIGIARALYNNPSLLVMDEATSALDSETEIAIAESLKKLSHKLTIIIIAHRKKTLEACDYVYRVESGKVELISSIDGKNI